MTSKRFCVNVEVGFNDLRLDIFLSQIQNGLTRSNAQKLISNSKVLVNNATVKPAYKVKTGDMVEVFFLPATPSEAIAEDIPLDIIFEDESVIVLNKSANMVVHPAAGNYTGTMVNALLHHCKDLSGIGGVMRPGIVHRLDKGTSGVIVVAKNDAAHNALSDQFQNRIVQKKYIALVFGRMPSDDGIISSEIGRDMKNRKKISSRTTQKRDAITIYKSLKTYKGFSLLELTPKTGRTHQIRVHLSESAHPIVGDDLYGGNKRLGAIEDTSFRKVLKDLDRFLLHAASLQFLHPKTNESMKFSAPIPADFQNILDILEKS